MALLYLSMLVNAMWYERVPPKPRASALEFGPFSVRFELNAHSTNARLMKRISLAFQP